MTAAARTGLDDLSAAGLREPVASLLAPFRGRLSDAERVHVVPDVAYPFHPTTGMVTDPAAVEALVAALRDRLPDATVGVALAGSEHADGRRSGRYLGYEALVDRLGVEYVDLDEAERIVLPTRGSVTPRTPDVPRPLVEGTIVNVPTLRSDRDRVLVAGTANLARAAGARDPTPADVVAAARALDPAVTVLDGTHTHAGAPHRSGFLLAAEDVASLDRFAASLLGRDPAEVPALRAAGGADPLDPAVVESLEPVRAALPNERPPAPAEPGPALRLGYRTYARITGDAVPPQFLDG